LIPVCLYVIWKKRRHDIDYGWMLLCFSSFITACALTHLCDVASFWWPGYRFFTLISVVAAVLSIGTALTLPWVVLAVLDAPTSKQFRQVNLSLADAIKAKDDTISVLNEVTASLSRQVRDFEQMRKTGRWVAEQEAILRELKGVMDAPCARESSP
jgi:hypothetical protein